MSALTGQQWIESITGGDGLPFSFRLDGGESATGADPASGLEVRLEARPLEGFAAAEWVVRFRNSGSADTAIISDIRALDIGLDCPREQSVRVHHALGSDCRIDDFAPLTTDLNPTLRDPQGTWRGEPDPLVLETLCGRSSEGALPFMNVELEGGGVVIAIGWTGDWRAEFWREDDGAVRARAGMKRTHFRLRPGEEVRSPKIVLIVYEGEWINGNNALRRLVLEEYAPRREAPISFAVWGENRTERQLGKVKWFRENEIGIENFWIDAGWYGDGEYSDGANVFNSDWGAHTGNWWPNKTAYPDGLAPIGEAVREAGMDFTLWFECERPREGTFFPRERPEWVLGPQGDNYLFNLGIPEAREALTDLVSSIIAEAGVTIYRQDFNMAVSPFWEAVDEPDRIGISEIRHIEGMYAFWDALIERHPGLLIDNCSSGGRRIDIETLSRSIPLWRSDFPCFKGFDPAGVQGETHGLSLWVPVHAGVCDRQDTYAFRSALSPGISLGPQPNDTCEPEGFLTPWDAFDTEWLRNAIREARAVRPYFAGDFYPLLSYSVAPDSWAAWQFDRPELGEGLVQAFRRQESPFAEMALRLRALDPGATYEVTDLDADAPVTLTGDELMSGALSIRIDEIPGARVLVYRRTV